ncbi:MAG: hypothetical protein Fur0023_16590 [Bacteroidia bacterium]
MKRYCSVFLLLVVSFILFNNCSYQKRLYRKGYYIEKWSHLKTKQHYLRDGFLTDETMSFKPANVWRYSDADHILASSEILDFQKNIRAVFKKKYNLQDTCGDKIILKTGDEFLVKIIEVSDKEIKYKRCDNIDGPLYSIAANKVYMIEYANGIKEHIVSDEIKTSVDKEKSKTENNKNSGSGKKKYPDSYWLAWVLFGLGFVPFIGGLSIFTWPMAMFYARKARRQIRDNPNYKGRIEMGCIMYFLMVFYGLIALTLIILGIIMMTQPYYFFTVAGMGVFMGTILFLIGLAIGALLLLFIKTSKPEDF